MNIKKIYRVGFNVSGRERFQAVLVFVVIVGLFGFLGSVNAGWVKAYHFFNPCGFKQDYNFPCPSCGFTHSALAFARGDISESFYLQPAAGVFCLTLAIIGVFALLIGIFGLKFGFIDYFLAKVKISYLILIVLLIFAGGWAVTLARALMQ